MNDRAVDRALDTLDSTFPPVPDTAEALAARWAERDAQYARDRKPMDELQANVIRTTRMVEANRLPIIVERGRMYARAKTWTPPVHPDYGSLKDWLL